MPRATFLLSKDPVSERAGDVELGRLMMRLPAEAYDVSAVCLSTEVGAGALPEGTPVTRISSRRSGPRRCSWSPCAGGAAWFTCASTPIHWWRRSTKPTPMCSSPSTATWPNLSCAAQVSSLEPDRQHERQRGAGLRATRPRNLRRRRGFHRRLPPLSPGSADRRGRRKSAVRDQPAGAGRSAGRTARWRRCCAPTPSPPSRPDNADNGIDGHGN